MAFITRVVVLKLVSCGSPTTISSLKPSKSLTFCLHFLTAVSLLLILYALIAGVVCALVILILRVRRRNSRGNRKRDLTKQKDEGESHQPHRGGVHSGDEIGSD